MAEAAPDATAPPPPMTPTSANCDPPVKTSNDIAQVCATENPAATPSAPSERP